MNNRRRGNCGLIAIHTIAYGYVYVEIIEQRSTFYITLALILNYPNFSDSCLFCKFPCLVDLPQMVVYASYIHAKQISHLLP